MAILEDWSGRTDQHDLAAHRRRRELTRVHPPIGDEPDRSGRSRVVDRHRPCGATEHHRRDWFARRLRRDRRAERHEPLIGQLHASVDAVGIRHGYGVGGDRVAERPQLGVASEDRGRSVRPDRRRREDDVSGPRDRGREGIVITRVCPLRELEVDRDPLGAGLDEVVDHTGVVSPREREVRAREIAQRRGIDADHHEVPDQLRSGPADLETSVDRLQLGSMEDPGRVGQDSKASGEDRDQCQQQPAPPTPAHPPHLSHHHRTNVDHRRAILMDALPGTRNEKFALLSAKCGYSALSCQGSGVRDCAGLPPVPSYW